MGRFATLLDSHLPVARVEQPIQNGGGTQSHRQLVNPLWQPVPIRSVHSKQFVLDHQSPTIMADIDQTPHDGHLQTYANSRF